MEEIESVGVTDAVVDEMIEAEIEEETGNVNFVCICPADYIICNTSHLTQSFIY